MTRIRSGDDDADPFAPALRRDPSLIEAIVSARRFNERLLHGGAGKLADLARSEKLHRSLAGTAQLHRMSERQGRLVIEVIRTGCGEAIIQ
jgi:hypothetical protein